jgi:hypothetical protein
MLKAARLYNIIIALSLALAACQSAGTVASQKEREYTAFGVPERVTIRGYGDHTMEPFITRDEGDLVNNLPGTILRRRCDRR